MQNTNIEWAKNSWNPWIGCSKISPGCKNCYAETDMDTRRKRVKWGPNGTRSVTSYAYWRQPLKWDAEAKAANERHRVFCASLADVFEDWQGNILDSKGNVLYWPTDYFNGNVLDVQNIPTFAHQTEKKDGYEPLTMDVMRQYIFSIIEYTSNLDWLLLTKRPENVMRMVPDHWQKNFPKNVWMGTSVENQEMMDERLPLLAKIPAQIKFLSCEPLLEKVSFMGNVDVKLHDEGVTTKTPFHWVIVGGESGSKKRPFDIQWARELKQQCDVTGVAFFFKQIDKVKQIPHELLIRELPV